eukprot:104447-Amorphochlora_amoeboformis.AAC.2
MEMGLVRLISPAFVANWILALFTIHNIRGSIVNVDRQMISLRTQKYRLLIHPDHPTRPKRRIHPDHPTSPKRRIQRKIGRSTLNETRAA